MPTSFAELGPVAALAEEITARVVWCTVTTVGPGGEPRSRLMHPVWAWEGPAPVALVTARPTAIKTRHLASNPLVACFYWDPTHDTVEIDARAEWLDRAERHSAWNTIAALPPPVGFDPAVIWPEGPDSDDSAILRFTAHRIVATPVGQPGLRWSV